MSSKKKQLGATLLEALAALAIIGGVMVLANNLTNDYSTNQRAAVTAQYVTTVGNAAQAYIKDNYAALTAAATATVPAVVTVPMLVSTNYLTTGFSATNNQNQTACVLVLQPTANNLQALVITEGGNTIDDLTLGQVAATVGAAGGGIYSTATTTVKGAMGGWSFAVGNYANSATHCDGSAGAAVLAAGHPMEAIWFNNGSLATAYLYRNSVAGHPELNTMNTPLIMSSTQTTGTACTTTGAIAQDGSGAVISCQGGTWKTQGSAFWQDPVASFAGLPACGASIAWQTRVVKTPTTGSGPRAYTCDGAAWQALAVNDSGNLTVAGNLTVGGTATINAMNGNLQVTATAAEGAACTGEGRIAASTTTSGLILSCQSGIWHRQKFGLLTGVETTCSGTGGPVGISCTALCPAGTLITSGGCSVNVSGGFTDSTASFRSGNGWYCAVSSDNVYPGAVTTANGTAYCQ